MQAISRDAITSLGWFVHDNLSALGRFTVFMGAVFERLIRHPFRCLRWGQFAGPLVTVGVQSVVVVSITGAFIGMILSLETYAQFEVLGQAQRLGGVINIAVTKQIGPVLAAVMIAGRVGGALAAELGTMRITEQLDAMEAMDADPLRILVAPRVVACVIMAPILTVFSDALGSLGCWFITVKVFGVSNSDYWFYTADLLETWQPITGLIKAAVFGLAIGLISCYMGFICTQGAAGVGRAATNAFVYSFLAIIAINLVLADFLNSLWIMIYGVDRSILG
ncbi:MAG: ABC transporter permease [Planctomycetota bacterium]|nr:ABC transporter permease [Planctomycetota bacterium]MDA1105137.1 ABC transporter permease [Planctomycetota bacterium]